MRILAIDLGTSSLKIMRMDDHARIMAIDRVPMSGLDIDAWMAAIGQNVRERGDSEAITAISLTGQMHGLMTRVDNARRGIGIPWHDQRTAAMLPELQRRIGPAAQTVTGGPLAPGFLATSLAWVLEQDPEQRHHITAVSVPKDALIHQLTGAHVTDPSDAAGTGLFDVRQGTWAWGVVDALGIPHHWLPHIIPSGSVAGTLSASSAGELGLPEGIPVIAAGGDAPVGAYGAGIKRENDALVMLSTGAQVILAAPHANPDPAGRWYTWPSVAPQERDNAGFLNVGTLLNAGNLLAWANSILPDDASSGRPTSLLALPHLIGTRAHPGHRAAIVGLTEATTAGDVQRSLIEGIGYTLRQTLEGMTGDGRPPTRILVGGGLSQNQLHRQVLADVLGIPLEHVDQPEVTAYGAGLLALHTVIGFAPDDAASTTSNTTPIPDHVRHYDGLYPLFLELDNVVGPISERLGKFVSDP